MDQSLFPTSTSISPLPPNAGSPAKKIIPIAFYFGIVIVMVGTLMLCIHYGFHGGISGVPFAFGPLMLAWVPMWLCRSQRSQGVFLFANMAFACWFLSVHIPMLYSGQVGEFDVLGTIAIGMYSSPVLLLLSIMAMVLHWQDSRPNSSPGLHR